MKEISSNVQPEMLRSQAEAGMMGDRKHQHWPTVFSISTQSQEQR